MSKTVFIICVLFIGGVILAQQADDERHLTCDEQALLDEYAVLQAKLAGLEDQLADDPAQALATLYDAGLTYQLLALDCGHIPDNIDELVVGTDVDRILTALESVIGDPLNGQLLYNNEADAADGNILGCVGCHSEEEVAPLTEGTWTRWDEIRTREPGLEEYSFERYMVESIVHPWDYLVPGYGEVMPTNFGDRMSYQNMADIIAYLSSQDQFLD